MNETALLQTASESVTSFLTEAGQFE